MDDISIIPYQLKSFEEEQSESKAWVRGNIRKARARGFGRIASINKTGRFLGFEMTFSWTNFWSSYYVESSTLGPTALAFIPPWLSEWGRSFHECCNESTLPFVPCSAPCRPCFLVFPSLSWVSRSGWCVKCTRSLESDVQPNRMYSITLCCCSWFTGYDEEEMRNRTRFQAVGPSSHKQASVWRMEHLILTFQKFLQELH